jgi:predicted alpha/beta superfamily hydrolase
VAGQEDTGEIMRTRRFHLVLAAALILATHSRVSAQEGLPPVTIVGTQVHTLSSEIAGRDLLILVALPAAYAEEERAFPVVYALDADFMFSGPVEVARTLAYAREAQEAILVGIAYGASSLAEWQWLRRRDYTPTTDPEGDAAIRAQGPLAPEVLSGQAASMLRVIREEIQPLVDGAYRTVPEESGFFGDSFGGLFGLFVLFHAPETFRHYLIGSPSIWWDDRVTLAFEEEYASRNQDLDAEVFLSVGLLEEDPSDPESARSAMVSNLEVLIERLEARGYPSLRLESHFFEGETHMSVVPFNFSRAFRALYSHGGS